MRNPYQEWIMQFVDDLSTIESEFARDKPKTGGADTETTGLHIKKDRPFLIQFGWLVPGESGGKVYLFYPSPENMKVFLKLAKTLKYFVWHNTKYDLHMLANIGYEKEVQEMDNLCENMVLARLTLEAIPTRDGGDSLALKDLGVKYVHPDADRSEKLIKAELKKLRDEQVTVLSAALKQFDHPTERTYKAIRKDTGKPTTNKYAADNSDNVFFKWLPKKWGKGLVEDFLKDITNDVDDLPEDVREIWLDWKEEYPEPTYADIDSELMNKYAGEDIITMLEFFKRSFPTLLARDQLKVLERENKCILPLFRMERVGMKTDRKYLEECRVKVKNYIKQQRAKLCELAGETVTVGQHETLKKIYLDKWNMELPAVDKPILKKIIKDYKGEPKRFAELIKELRTLEKWYSTYILRLLDKSEYDGRSYTQIHQASAVSGRVGSDFQQMPKDPLNDENGNELYHPRKPFTVPEGYNWYFLDFSQVELRTQANYTILVSGGDINLCRSFMPFKCKHYSTGEIFNYEDVEERKRWKELQPNGDSAWLEEDGKPWEKTDVHGATTMKAFPHIEPGTDEFKKMRSKGKIFNFLANYGGGKGAAIAALDLDDEEADALVRGYSEAFPHVLLYQQAIQRQHAKNGYVKNMYGRRYYIKDNRKAYKLANYCVQGTDADLLKECIIEVDEFLKDKESKFVMNIHDELSFYTKQGEEWIMPKLRDLMENHPWHLVPIVSDAELTKTNWEAKEDVVL